MSVIRIGTTSDSVSRTRAQVLAAFLATGDQNQCDVHSEELTAAQLHTALIDSGIDLLVSSAADLSQGDPRVSVAAYLKRGDSRDALCSRDGLIFDTFTPGAHVVVGTARRAAQVLARRPDVECEIIELEVEELLALVASGKADAVGVAADDLDHLHRLDAISEYLGNDGWPTAPGQGSIAVRVRADLGKGGLSADIRSLNHGPTRTIVEAEIGILDRLGSAGKLVGAHGIIDDGLLFVSARVYRPDGTEKVTSSHALYLADVAHPAQEIADRVATELVALGALTLAAGTSASTSPSDSA